MTKLSALQVENSILRERVASLEAQLAANYSQVYPANETEQAQFRALFESMQLGVVYQDADGSITLANPAAERILGLSLDQMQGRKPVDPRWRTIHADGLDFTREQYPAMEALRTGNLVKDVVIGISQPHENEYRWIMVTATPEFCAGEIKPYRVHTTFVDITERKRAEKALCASEAKFRSLFHNVPMNVVIYRFIRDEQNEIVDWEIEDINPLNAAEFHQTPAELIGKRASAVFDTQALEAHLELYRTVAASRQSQRLETHVAYNNKDYISIIFAIDSDFFATVGLDITERKKAEDELHHAREFLQRVQDSLSAHIAILDENGIIVEVNQAWREFGEMNGSLSAKGYLGMNYLTICDSASGVHADEAGQVAQAIRKVLAGEKEEFQLEYPCNSPDEDRWFDLRITKFQDGNKHWVVMAHENITQRKLAEEALRDSEEKYRTFIEQTSDAIAFVDEKGNIIEWNRAREILTGLKREAVLGKSYWDIRLELTPPEQKNPEYLQQLKSIALEMLQTGRSQFLNRTGEGELVTTGGERKTIEQIAFLIQTKKGYRITSLTRDITHRKQTELALKESEERFHQMFEKHNAVMLLVEPDSGAIIDANAAAQKYYGYPIGTLKQMTIQEINVLSPEEVAERRNQALRESLNFFVFPHRLASGEIRTVEVHSSPIVVSGRSILFSIIHDITERELAKKKLIDSEMRFRNLVETTSDWIWEIDTNGVYTYASPRVFDFLGYQPEEIVGRIPFDLMAPDEAKRIEALFATIFASQSPFSNLENRNLHKDGQIVVLETSGLPIVDNEDVFRGYRGIDRDITERKRADAAQQEVLTKLQTLLENVEQGILYEDETRHVQFSNNTFCELFGIPSPQIILGAACDALALQAQGSFADPEEFINGVQNRLDQQVVVLSEELNLADGRIFERDYIPVIISGRQSGNYWIYRDITGRKQADGALSESEARFRSLIEQSTDGVVLIDAQGIVIEWNTAESLITGIPLSRALGASFSEIQYQILIPEHREKLNPEYLRKVFFELFQSGNAGRLGIPQDIEIISLSGERKFVQQTSFLVRSDKGNRIGAIVRDVTKQKKMEDALRRSEEKYRSLAENIESGVATVDAQGVLHYINSVAAAALGGNPEDLTGKRLHQLFPLEVADHQLKSIRHVIASGQGTVRETQNIIAAGMRWYRASIQPIRSAGGAGLALIHVIDITARKESEEKIRSTLEEKESLLREVHHRVKNNLQAMIALMDMQSRLIAEEDSRGFLKELKGQARTMALVYEQLYQSDNLARVEMAPYIGQLTANILEVFGRNRHIELNLNITSLLDVGDATPCGLIINELFTNILKYAFPSGFVGRPTVTIDLHQEGRTCHLTVSDNGVGLPPDLDLRSSPTLGLRLVNLWVTHQLGGTLEVDGQSGTTFSIFFETQQ